MAPQPNSGRGEGTLPSRDAGVSPTQEAADQGATAPPATAHQQPDRRLDLRWTGANLGAVILLCLLAAAALSIRAAASCFELGDRPAVDERRVQAAAERVNPNTASAASLRRLPRVGPEHLRAILDYRAAHDGPAGASGGPAFRDANDLSRVRGIGQATLQTFRDYLEFPAGR